MDVNDQIPGRPADPWPAAAAGAPREMPDERSGEALSSREAQYRAVIETSRDGFWSCDREGRILEVNEAYIRRSGYTREELLSMRIRDLEAQDGPEEIAARIEQVIRDGNGLFETHHRTKDGTVWPVEVAVSYSPVAGGRFFGFHRDITDRRQAEASLRERWKFFETIIEAAPT